MKTKLFTCLREICRQCYKFNNLGHRCAYSAILRLKIINNKSIEAIELSKVPRDIWGRVALSEITPRTDLDGVVLCNSHQSVDLTWDTGHIGYIYIYIYIYKLNGRTVMDIYIYVFPRAGARYYRWNLIFFSFFIFSHSQHCLKICVPCC